MTDIEDAAPSVFLSYAAEDTDHAEKIARKLFENGIETWWDKWCIGAGDSLRQKIDEGLNICTHFLVLLTPVSVQKPWVNEEIDAGLVQKISGKCRFLPIRFGLTADKLPPLIAKYHVPEIRGDDEIRQLVSDILQITKKPKLGPIPGNRLIRSTGETGYSQAADLVAEYFVEKTRSARFGDPNVRIKDLAEKIGMSMEDTEDAIHELSVFFRDHREFALPEPHLFSAFDKYWKSWDPAADARKLAADIMNDKHFPSDCGEIASRYDWQPRRLNPAATYLFKRDLIIGRRSVNSTYEFHGIIGKRPELRRFMRDNRQLR